MPHPLNDYVGYRLIQVMKGHRMEAEPALNALGLYLGQEMLLFQLWEEEGLTQSELGERWGVDPSTVTKSVQRLENAGILERRQDTEDRRVYRVYLTEKGRALEEPVRTLWRQWEAKTTQGFSDIEKALLLRLLSQIQDNFGDTGPDDRIHNPK
jgi:DNA-binding MarR family transcriptional regulator